MDPTGFRSSRRLLGAALVLALVALAGCSDPIYSLEMTPVDEEGIANRYATNVSDLGEEDRRVVTGAIANGTATTVGERPRVRDGLAVRHEGTYYGLAVSRDGEVPATEYTLEFEPAEGATATVDEEDLPEIDRDEFTLEIGRGDEETVTETVTFTDGMAARSALVGDGPTVVDDDGDLVRVTVTDRSPSSLPRYRYAAERVADSRAELADHVRERYLFALSDLPGEQRELLDRAVEEGEVETLGSPPEGFDGLVDRLRDHAAVRASGGSGTWLLRYEGTVYWVVVRSSDHDFDDASASGARVAPSFSPPGITAGSEPIGMAR